MSAGLQLETGTLGNAVAVSATNPLPTTSVSTSSAPEFFRSVGFANIATGQVAVTTSATQVVPARAGRGSVTITSTSAVVFYVGVTGVTVANGAYVAAAAGASITLNTSAAVFAIGASALTVSFIEVY